MTRYEKGFLTKCAEAGLDAGTSMKLMEKSALNWKMLGAYAKDIARHPVKAGRRWWELMRGGSDKVLGNYRKIMREAQTLKGNAIKNKDSALYKAYGDLMDTIYAGVRDKKWFDPSSGKGKVFRMGDGGPLGGKPLLVLRSLGDGVSSADTARELNKVLATRIGTAAGATALGGGVYAAARGGRNRGNSGGGDRILGNYSKLMEPTDGNHRILGNYANLIG